MLRVRRVRPYHLALVPPRSGRSSYLDRLSCNLARERGGVDDGGLFCLATPTKRAHPRRLFRPRFRQARKKETSQAMDPGVVRPRGPSVSDLDLGVFRGGDGGVAWAEVLGWDGYESACVG